jgi:hypothetical protein
VYRQPLDEATTRRLDKMGNRVAEILKTGVGLFFLGCGLMGFLLTLIVSHQPAFGSLPRYSFELRFLPTCGFLAFIGARILLSGPEKPDAAWLVPLQAFTRIVSMRVAREETKRKDDERRGLGPG